MWGTPLIPVIVSVLGRFIPTGVGNTQGHTISYTCRSVHPHGCGEHQGFPRRHCQFAGSSPRVWGTQTDRPKHTASGRFIPTGVGNTARLGIGTRMDAVHPHGCGEHVPLAPIPPPVHGSSPRVWGTPASRPSVISTIRFIPTGVGNTPPPPPAFLPPPVHPHGCGEHGLWCYTAVFRGGSSPRVWGTQQRRAGQMRAGRFIPTGVGNTSAPPILPMCAAVHPHGCGEHGKRHHVPHVHIGSSPRVWGTRV